jgi:hypothetical protein
MLRSLSHRLVALPRHSLAAAPFRRAAPRTVLPSAAGVCVTAPKRWKSCGIVGCVSAYHLCALSIASLVVRTPLLNPLLLVRR